MEQQQRYSLVLRVMVIVFSLVVSSCGQDLSKVVNEKIILAETRIANLKTELDNNQVRNANILREYGKILAQDKPELAALITALMLEGTSEGQQYKVLISRLTEITELNSQFTDPHRLLEDIEGVIAAADPLVFSETLIDPINVLADMSNGKLARIGVVAKNEEKDFNDVKDFGVGSQLVGNPAYGHWTQGNGTSFWEWYGMYAMFSNLIGGNRIYYNSWDRFRPYSYYQDYGMNRFGSVNERNKYASNYQKSSHPGRTATNSKTYSGTRKSSSYSKGSGVSARQNTPRKSSTYSGSLRNSGYSSRSYFGGK